MKMKNQKKEGGGLFTPTRVPLSCHKLIRKVDLFWRIAMKMDKKEKMRAFQISDAWM